MWLCIVEFVIIKWHNLIHAIYNIGNENGGYSYQIQTLQWRRSYWIVPWKTRNFLDGKNAVDEGMKVDHSLSGIGATAYPVLQNFWHQQTWKTAIWQP